jgi:hypothetical protein
MGMIAGPSFADLFVKYGGYLISLERMAWAEASSSMMNWRRDKNVDEVFKMRVFG